MTTFGKDLNQILDAKKNLVEVCTLYVPSYVSCKMFKNLSLPFPAIFTPPMKLLICRHFPNLLLYKHNIIPTRGTPCAKIMNNFTKKIAKRCFRSVIKGCGYG